MTGFLSFGNKFKLIISKINNIMVRIDYLPWVTEQKKSAHTYTISIVINHLRGLDKIE